MFAQHGRKAAENRAKDRRVAPACVAAGVLALAVAVGPAALAQSRSGITINSDVLNGLGSGPGAAPGAPLPPQPSYEPNYQPDYAPAPGAPPSQAPQPQGGQGNMTFQPYGGDNFVVTRPGTLLFPPLEAPTSTLAPGFQDDRAANHAARTEAMTNAFAEGPEPASQLLIPLDGGGSGVASADNSVADNSVVVFMDNLPDADPDAPAGDGPVLTLRRPPLATFDPAPRKPEVSPAMLAEVGVTSVDDSVALAPEFQAPAPAVAEVPPVAEVETAPIDAMPAAEDTAPPAVADAAPESAPTPEPMEMAATPSQDRNEGRDEGQDAPVSLLPAASGNTPTNEPAASSDVPAPVAPALADSGAPETAPGVQTASLTVGEPVEDMSVTFDTDSAELSDPVQAELRALANSLRSNDEGRIQVLGFASAEGGSQDLARKLALSRALKVRTFLIDAGVSSARIQVRSLGDKAEGGPANRVDIRPIDS